MSKKVLFFLFITLFFANFSYSEGLASKEVITHFNDGVKAQRAGNLRDAFTAYQTAILLAPEDNTYRKFILNNTGVLYARRGDVETAKNMFRDALSLDPNYTKANLNLGLIYYRAGDRAIAAEYLMRAYNIDIDSIKPTVYMMEGEAGSGN